MSVFMGIPPIGFVGIAAFRSPADKGRVHYDSDCRWFLANPKRNVTIRTAIFSFGEAKLAMNASKPPLLHSLVVQMAPGFHMEIPLWRGPAIWEAVAFGDAHHAVIPSDGEAWSLAKNTCMNQGMSLNTHLEYKRHLEAFRIPDETETDRLVN